MESKATQWLGWSACWGSDAALVTYLNRADVQDALHVHFAPEKDQAWSNRKWEVCSDKIDPYDRSATDLSSLYPKFAAKGVRVLIFSGDADACVPYVGTNQWVTELAEKEGWQPAAGASFVPTSTN